MLRRIASDDLWFLEADSLVGRSAGSTLRLTHHHASAQHASVRWTGTEWQLRDLGSRNGTWLDGARLEPSQSTPLRAGLKVAFGDPDDPWVVDSVEAPVIMVVALARARQIIAEDGILGIPSEESPDATVYRTAAGSWILETEGSRPATLTNGAHFEVAGELYRFCCPDVTPKTVTMEAPLTHEPTRLHFQVSRDEEFVELHIETPTRTLNLGSRSHNHLLLTLARARLRDAEAGEPETSSGWVYKEDLISGVDAPQRVDNEVFRARKHFMRLMPNAGVDLIERRPRTRQLRIGLADLRISEL